jgi:hypothetical protein
MSLSLLDDIKSSRDTIQKRANKLVDSMRTEGGYTWDNAQKNQTYKGNWFGADKERIRQLDLLSDAIKAPEWTASLDKEVAAREKAGNVNAEAGHRQGEDSRKVAGATAGTAGSSWDAVVQAQNAQELANTKAKVHQQVSELRAAGIQNLDEMGRQLLEKAISGGDEASAMNVSSKAALDAGQSSLLASQNNDTARNLLGNTISGFLSNTVTPAVQMGFTAADRWNTQQRDNYRDARDQGIATGTYSQYAANNGGTRSFWGW